MCLGDLRSAGQLDSLSQAGMPVRMARDNARPERERLLPESRRGQDCVVYGSCPSYLKTWAIVLVVFASTAATVPASPTDEKAQEQAMGAAAGMADVPLPLQIKHPRTEAESDHLEAVTLFATGRSHERREEWNAALRCYERAYRLDPQVGLLARDAMATAIRLKRYAEASRYFPKVSEFDDSESLLLRRLGVYLTEEGDLARAVEAYEKALASHGKGKDAAADIVLHMERGRLCQLLGKAARAAESFAKVTAALDHPDEFGIDEPLKKILLGEPSATYIAFGDSFLETGRFVEARAAFQKADALAPNPLLLKYNLARVDALDGKPADALVALEACLAASLRGEGSTPYETLAGILKQLGKSEELLPRLEKLHLADKDNVPLTYFLATQYRTAGKLEKAESLYVALLEAAATRTTYRDLVDLYRENKRYDALLAALGRVADDLGVLGVLGVDAQKVSGNPDMLRALVDAARARAKSNPDQCTSGMRQAIAILAIEAKQFDLAKEFFEIALTSKPKQVAELLLAWGVGLLMEEHAAEAVAIFQRGVDEKALPGDNPAFYFYLAGALAMSKRTDEALSAARKAAEIATDSSRFQERTAWVLYFSKRYPEARKAYEELLEKFDASNFLNENRAVMRQAKIILSNICVVLKCLPQAEEYLEQVLDEFPDDVGAMNDLGYLWADQNKNLVRAERMIRQAVEVDPDNIAYRDSLGWVLFRLGRYSEAVAELEKAVGGKKIDGVVLDHLGDAYQRAHMPAKAADAWQRAAKALRAENDVEKAELIEKKMAP